MVIGGKRLPEGEEAHERLRALVAEWWRGPDLLREALGPRMYETRTRGG
jgi:hypothetical protein